MAATGIRNIKTSVRENEWVMQMTAEISSL